MKEIQDLLNVENARKVAEEILETLKVEMNEKNAETDFGMHKGIMERKYVPNSEIRKIISDIHGKDVPAPNVSFSFNSADKSLLRYIKDTLTKAIDNNEFQEEDYDHMQSFIKNIINIINSDDILVSSLRNSVRKNLFNDADEEVFPFKEIYVVLFEFGSKEDYGDIVRINNYQRFDKRTNQFVGEKKSISKDLLTRRREFGWDNNIPTSEIYAKIIQERKDANDPLYCDVLPEDVTVVQEAKECHIDIFADCSPISKEEFESKLQKIESKLKE